MPASIRQGRPGKVRVSGLSPVIVQFEKTNPNGWSTGVTRRRAVSSFSTWKDWLAIRSSEPTFGGSERRMVRGTRLELVTPTVSR